MDILSRQPLRSDHRLPYAGGALQFGDLWLPAGGTAATKQRAPLVVFFHGGWWQAEYDLGYTSFLADALKRAGMAVWTPEYRRVGDAGGGWPGTFQDAAAALDFAKALAGQYPLDLARVVVAGHSAGAHLAFWNAARHHVPEGSVLYQPRPSVAIHAAVALAGAVDLRLTCELAGFFSFPNGKRMTASLMGGLPDKVPERYRAGDPGELLPLGVPQVLLQGMDDGQIPPELPGKWAAKARAQHDSVTVTMLPGADHFDVVDPESRAWPQVLASFQKACFG